MRLVHPVGDLIMKFKKRKSLLSAVNTMRGQMKMKAADPKHTEAKGKAMRAKLEKNLGSIADMNRIPAAVFIVALTFILPREYRRGEVSEALLDWHTVEKRLPWGVILLLGGGFALKDITQKSGLDLYLVDRLDGLKELSPLVVGLIIAITSTFVTEVASNTACANILVPILSKMSISLCSNPLYLMMTCAVCVSYAFMLPVATAPNAIVYSASSLKTSDMMRAGFFMNILCILTTW